MAGLKDPCKGQSAVLADFAGRAVRGALEVCVAGRGEGRLVAVVEGQGQRLASEPWDHGVNLLMAHAPLVPGGGGGEDLQLHW